MAPTILETTNNSFSGQVFSSAQKRFSVTNAMIGARTTIDRSSPVRGYKHVTTISDNEASPCLKQSQASQKDINYQATVSYTHDTLE